MKMAGSQTSPQAQGWYHASRRGHVPRSYARFICLWEALCAWFRDVKDMDRDADAKAWLKEYLADWHKDRLGDPEYGASVRQLKSLAPIWKMRGREPVCEKKITDESDFGQIVDVIYTVRCNLMKGGKRASPDDRETGVCGAASQVLDPIVEWLVLGPGSGGVALNDGAAD